MTGASECEPTLERHARTSSEAVAIASPVQTPAFRAKGAGDE